jgi:hypothetical protein
MDTSVCNQCHLHRSASTAGGAAREMRGPGCADREFLVRHKPCFAWAAARTAALLLSLYSGIMALSFEASSPAGLAKLNEHLLTRSYITGCVRCRRHAERQLCVETAAFCGRACVRVCSALPLPARRRAGGALPRHAAATRCALRAPRDARRGVPSRKPCLGFGS